LPPLIYPPSSPTLPISQSSRFPRRVLSSSQLSSSSFSSLQVPSVHQFPLGIAMIDFSFRPSSRVFTRIVKIVGTALSSP
ncbi:hypothetical protein PENTCL1PPCAC_21691, partial [Pristionchus entomophagus]